MTINITDIIDKYFTNKNKVDIALETMNFLYNPFYDDDSWLSRMKICEIVNEIDTYKCNNINHDKDVTIYYKPVYKNFCTTNCNEHNNYCNWCVFLYHTNNIDYTLYKKKYGSGFISNIFNCIDE